MSTGLVTNTLVADVRMYLDEATANQWTDANILTCINFSYWDLLRRAEELTGTRLTSSTDIDLVASTQEYDLPSDCETVVDVRDNNLEVPIPVLTFNERDFHQDSLGVWGLTGYFGDSYVAYIKNAKIGFCPTPSASDSDAITVTYIAEQSELAAGAKTTQLPNKFKELIVLNAYKRLKAIRNESLPPELAEVLGMQWASFDALIQQRDRQDGMGFRWGEVTDDRTTGFLPLRGEL